MDFFTSLLAYGDWGLFALRVAVGVIFLTHGIYKLKSAKMTGNWKVLGTFEILGGLGILLGIYTQLAALGLSLVMVGAIYMKTQKWKAPFMVMEKPGWEFDVMLLAGTIALLLMGPGSIFSFGW